MYELREGVPHFVLIDYDMAVILTTKAGERRKPTAKYREGTLPFMAVDLLMNAANPWRKPIPHFLRHDFESVYWLSVWSPAVLMDPQTEAEKEAKQSNVDIVRAWETGKFGSIADTKEAVRRRSLTHRNIKLIGKAASLGTWYRQWRTIWRKVDAAILKNEDAVADAEMYGWPLPSFDFETVEGLVTRDSIIAALNSNPEATERPSDIQPELPEVQPEVPEVQSTLR